MPLTPAEKQARYRSRLAIKEASRVDMVEAALLKRVDRVHELSDADIIALADELTAFATKLQWRAAKLARLAIDVRGGLWRPEIRWSAASLGAPVPGAATRPPRCQDRLNSPPSIPGIFVGADSLFVRRRDQLAGLAARHAMPAIYPLREFADTGGLMSYAPSQTDAERCRRSGPATASRVSGVQQFSGKAQLFLRIFFARQGWRVMALANFRSGHPVSTS